MYAQKIEEEKKLDILDQTFGTWYREESAQQTVERARKAFHESMVRHYK